MHAARLHIVVQVSVLFLHFIGFLYSLSQVLTECSGFPKAVLSFRSCFVSILDSFIVQ